MKLRLRTLACLLAVLACWLSVQDMPAVAQEAALKALVVTGQNNHGWQSSTPILKQLLEQTGLFTVDLAVSPGPDENMEGFRPAFDKYDVVVLDYNGETWAEETRTAFVDYVKTGGGVVVYHAADNSFPDWKEYNEIIGLGGWKGRDETSGPYIRWRNGRVVRDTTPGKGGSHGARHDFQVVLRDMEHPVTAGLPVRWMHAEDELYSQLRGPAKNLTVLATAFADPKHGGTGEHEPILFTISYGKGRIFHTVLGHVGRASTSVPSVQCAGFITTFQRGAEWAATGKVTQQIPQDFPTADKVSKRCGVMTAAGLDELLAKIAHYEYGQSRTPLAEMGEYLRSTMSSPQALKRIEGRFIELLRAGDTTPAGKQFICQTLSIIGTEESVPVLVKMLTEKATSDFEPSDMARYALERIPSPAADQALREALSKTNGKVKIGIINSIGQRGGKQSVKDLTALLDDDDKNVATAAIWALGNMGTRKAANSLRRLSSITDPQMHAAWANAYLMCADKLLAKGKAKAALRIYRYLSSSEQDEAIRCAVLRGMVLSDPEQAPSIMLAGFLSPDERMQAAAVGVLREVRGSEIIKAITARYAELPLAGRVRVLSVLGELGDRAALPAVESASGSSDADIRTAAFEALGSVGDASHVGLLAETAGRTGDPAQDAARQSLYRLSAPNVDARILELIPDSDPDVKVELILVAGQRNIGGAAPTLLAAAQSGPSYVRVESLKVLADIAGPEHVQSLLQLLLDADNQIERRQAEVAVAAAATKQTDTQRRADAVLAMLPSVTAVEAKSSLLSVLGKIGGADALAVLKESLKDTNVDIRTAAIRALSDWPTPEPIDTLGDIARNADQAVHRALAFRGFVRLAGLSSERSPMETVDLYREAMGFAVDPGQKKLVLAQLAKLGSFEALQTTAGYLDDSDLQGEAEVAVVGIAESTWPAHPELTKAFLSRLLETSKNETVRQRGQAVVERIAESGDYIRSWEVSGPYVKQGLSPQELYGVVFAPEQDHGENAEWQAVWAGADIDRPWAVDLLKALGGGDCAAYLRTNVWSPQTQDAQLLVGSNDGIKVWLNNSVAHENNVLRSLVRDEDKVDITLKRGWNSLMLKVTQSGGQWGACARFRGSDGSKLEDLRVCPYRTVVSGLELTGPDFSAWRGDTGTWQVTGDALTDPANEKLLAVESGTGVIINGPNGRTVDLLSKAEFCDVAAHIEFMVPRSSNSGVYFMGRYEVQVLDSWGVEEPTFSDCGGIYQRWDGNRNPKGYEGRSPRTNASLPPGQWQSFDVVFRGPRFDKNGNKVANARFVKVVHNGIVVHTNEEVTGPTRAARYKDEKPAGPLMLQGDHGPVAYRNIWVLPLEQQ